MLALLIIDQQKGIDHAKLGARNNPGADKQMLEILARWRQQQWPVFHIKHRSVDPRSVFWPDQDGFNFKTDFLPEAGEKIIEKSTPCAFSHTSLAKELADANIQKIVIVGASTNNSVEATARTGGNLGFKVYVVENACFAFAKADYFGTPRTAQEVHAMSLANLEGEYAQVISSAQLFKLVS